MFLSLGADGNIIIENKEIYRQLVFTSTNLVGDNLHSLLWLKI